MQPDLKRTIHTRLAPNGRGPFPQAVAVGPLVFVSGQGPLSPETNEPIAGAFEAQVQQTFANVEAILDAAGLRLLDIAKVTVYLSDVSNVPAFNAIYERLMPAPLPARTLVQAGLRGIDVEVDVIAVRAQQPAGAPVTA
jgi:2-iminobutanoate/2-iminopropanoate deaminase